MYFYFRFLLIIFCTIVWIVISTFLKPSSLFTSLGSGRWRHWHRNHIPCEPTQPQQRSRGSSVSSGELASLDPPDPRVWQRVPSFLPSLSQSCKPHTSWRIHGDQFTEVFFGHIAFGMADSRLSDPAADRMALFWSAFTLGRIPPVIFNEIYSQLVPRANSHEQVRRVFRVCWLAHQHATTAGYLFPTYQRVCMARRDLAQLYARMIVAPGQKKPPGSGGSGSSS